MALIHRASCRRGSAKPVTVTSHCLMPTMPSTTPMSILVAVERAALLDVQLEVAGDVALGAS